MACGLGGEYDARARFRVRPGVVVMEQNTKLSADVWQRRRVNSPLCASKLDGTSERCSRRTQPVSRATREEDTPNRGSQYLSIRYTERLAEAGIEPSVGSVGDSCVKATSRSRGIRDTRMGRVVQQPPAARAYRECAANGV